MDNNIAIVYQYIYLIFVAIVTIKHLSRYQSADVLSYHGNRHGAIILMVLVSIFIGLRPVSGYFVDMGNIKLMFDMLKGNRFEFTWDTDNKIYDNFLNWWGCNSYDQHQFFLIIAAIYFGCAYVGIKRLFGKHVLIAYVVFLAAFSTFGYSTNGIKAGAAASLFIMALGYMDKKVLCAALMLVSLGFHHSMIMPIAAFVFTIFYKNPKWYYYGWFACFLLAAFHITYFQLLFGGMTDEQGAGYLMATVATSEAHIGFRPDFVLYSAAPVWIGYQFEMKKNIKLSTAYHTLIHFYITTNAIWMLCMYASFTNRIAYLSWFVYPIVIIYPFLDSMNQDPRRFIKLRKVVLCHLAFTLFMMFIYYGILSFGR